MRRNYNVTICGGSRVGKSTLINALVGREVAKTSGSLRSCTDKVEKYTLERFEESSNGPVKYTIEFWDTPGIESWSQDNVRSFFSQIIQDTNPICMIYCASPGAFADIKQVEWFVQTCISQEIFVALVCTNMFAGNKRRQVMKNFIDLLESLRLPAQRREENDIVYFGRMALCTMVNSRQYLDEDIGINEKPSGIEELIFGITQCLDREKQLLWLRTVAENRTFWTDMSQRVSNLLHVPMSLLAQIWGQVYAKANPYCEPPIPPMSTIPTIPVASVTVENEVRSSRISSSSARRKGEANGNERSRPTKTDSRSKRDKIVEGARTWLKIKKKKEPSAQADDHLSVDQYSGFY